MKRRTFIKSSMGAGITLLSLPVRRASCSAANSPELMATWISENDLRIEEILQRQTRDSNHPFAGGFPDRYDIYHVSTAASSVRDMVAGFVSPQSRYHASPQVEASLQQAIEFLLDRQHDDGTIDLVTTNFHSPPDTGFVVEPLAIALNCLRQHAGDAVADLQRRGGEFLVKAGTALTRGGIHTPNHRWVVCMALARIHQLFPDEKYLRRIDQWLAEKIDIDPDGQYTEKSTAIYSPLVNRCLITLARLLNRPELLDPVRRNLEMTQYLVRANGEIVTEASRRQDQYRIAMLDRYYHAYRHMALHDDSSVYSGLVQFIEETSGHKALAGNLAYFLEDATLLRELPAPASPVDAFQKSFPHSGMVRIRRGQMDATILDHSDRILTFQKGTAALQGLRLASAFFGKGQFVADSLTHEDGAYVLRQTLSGPYYQPLQPEHLPGDGDWVKMPRQLRPTSEVQTLLTTITVREANGHVTVHFDVSGTSGVPLAIELAFRKEGKLSGVRLLDDQPGCWLLEDGSGTYQVGDDMIEFGPGKSGHRWTQLRGALPKLDADSVYVTGYTPFESELRIG